MKYYRNFFSQLKIYVTTQMSCTSKFASYVTMISDFFIVIIITFFTNPANVIWLESFFLFFIHDQKFLKVFFLLFFTVLILLKNCFNKFISSIFTPKNNNWLTKPIINTNNFVSKTARNVLLILFCVRTFINFNTLSITLKISINFKWGWFLFEIIFKLNCSFF